MKSERKLDRVKALIVGHGDGYIQCFGPPNLDAKFVLAPYVAGTAGELAAERFIDQQLRGEYRQLYMPGLIRTTGFIQRVTPARAAELLADLEFCRELNKLAERLRGAA